MMMRLNRDEHSQLTWIRPFVSPDGILHLGDRMSHVAAVPAARAAPARCYVSELAKCLTHDHERRIVMMMGTATIAIAESTSVCGSVAKRP
jgi:hypothetical protein